MINCTYEHDLDYIVCPTTLAALLIKKNKEGKKECAVRRTQNMVNEHKQIPRKGPNISTY